jgi:hypothetical protein
MALYVVCFTSSYPVPRMQLLLTLHWLDTDNDGTISRQEIRVRSQGALPLLRDWLQGGVRLGSERNSSRHRAGVVV